MLAFLISTLAAPLGGAPTTISGDLVSGCKTLGFVRLCRRGESAFLFVKGQRTNWLRGYLADNDTSYVIQRVGNLYRVSVGRPGASTDPLYLSYSIEFAPSPKRARLIRLVDTAELNCNGTGLPYNLSIDISRRTVTYTVKRDGSASGKARYFTFPLRAQNTDPYSVSFDEHLSMIGNSGKPRDRELCAAGAI